MFGIRFGLKESLSTMSDASATNPVSTGGGGTFFEQHVDALFLALLLVRAPLPILKDSEVEEVHLQAEHLGWKTDDVVVVAVRPDGVRRRLAVQVKRQFRISDKDETCRNAFGDFWSDFKGSEFDSATDRLALVTLRGTNALLDGLGSLLDCARASADSADFMRRLEVDKFLSKKAIGYATIIRQILDEAVEAPTDEHFWSFLCVLHIVSFDLCTSSAQNEAWIKALLAATATGGDAHVKADSSWRELLELVAAGMPTAASYLYADLPESLRNRHGPIDTRSTEVVRALSDHSSVTLDGIKTTIGARVEIARDASTTQVLEALNENQIVVISAPAGLGKSVVAKKCMQLLDRDFYCLAFRAEEFAVSHIDQTLQQSQVSANGSELLGILAGQGRKLVLVESVERLLEASVRDSFADLLNLAKRDRSLGLLITCRDYSLETVSASLLGQSGLAFAVTKVQPLVDEELEQTVSALPHLSNALHDQDLKALLRSPYLLDKAAGMDWSDAEGLPTNEREFRRRCWGEVIRRNAAAAGGLPDRRERVFEEVALRRARQLRPFVDIEDLDPGALNSLRSDGLIVTSPEATSLIAPSHDVLEDWANIHWLGQRWILHERSAGPLSADIGGYPAVRRAYRIWFTELLRNDVGAATDFVMAVFRDWSLPAYFRDDTLVCTLQSPSARAFLERHREALFDGGGESLVRVIHLMRVACKASPWWLRDGARVPSQMLVASGEAWPAVLELVLGGLGALLPGRIPVLLGLVEDFTNSIDWRDPEPKGFEEAAKIGFRLLGYLTGYHMDDMRKRTLKAIAKVPRGDEIAFVALINQAIADEDRDRIADEASEVLLSGIDGWTSCRYVPNEIIRLATSRTLLTEEVLDPDDWRRADSTMIEPYFGIRENTHFDAYPASSIRGVFLPLLRYHPLHGAGFIIDLLNHAGTWYGEHRWRHGRLEPAVQITIEVPGESPITQWANARLWGLYRGHQVGPYVLQSALMALEAWLLEICDLEGADVESWLLKILRESNNVMATSVVASFCNAHPEKAGRAGLALLSSRELIRLDRVRAVQERSHSAMSGIFPTFGINQIYENERKKSDAMVHRRYDLEALAVRLQLTEARENVFEIIDRHRRALPPVEEQSEEDRLWRLALHRMDVRGFRVLDETSAERPEPSDGNTSEIEETEERRIVLAPGEIEPDVQNLIDQHAPIAAQQERELLLLNWGNAAWQNRGASQRDNADWESFLTRARTRDAEPEPEEHLRGGPGLIAAVCARDHWDEMGLEDQAWCIEKLVREVERDCDTEDDIARHGRGAYHPDRHAAYVLPGLLSRGVSRAQSGRIIEAIAKALTHSVEEVALYAAEGIGTASNGEQRAFSEACIAAIAWRAQFISDRLAEERERPFAERVSPSHIIREAVPAVRAAIVAQDHDPRTELDRLNISDWPGTQAAGIILQILGHALGSALAIPFHLRIATSIAEDWDQELDNPSGRSQRHFNFSHQSLQRLAYFVLSIEQEQALQVCRPFIAAVATHPSEVKDFVRNLVVEADQRGEDDPFWPVWQAFADALAAAPWIDQLDSRYDSGKELVSAIFLANYWKEEVRDWHRLEGQGHRVDEFAAQFRGSAVVFDAYCQFLYDIGETSLPKAFVLLADSLTAGDATGMLSHQNSVFLLESLLRRHVYAEPYRLKSDRAVRAAVIYLLDQLVEAGSSAAYRMRDDFVTPLSGLVN